jgi:lipopolysaccharide export system permease protein
MIIQRYLVKEILFSFLGTLFVLLLIIVGNTFVRLLGDVSGGSLPVEVLGKLVSLQSINAVIKLVPIALLIGMMLAFGRLYRDHEVLALHASGIGPKQFYKGIFLFVGPLTLLVAALVLFVAPKLEQASQNIKHEIKQRPEAAGIPIGEFMHANVDGKKLTLFVEDIDKENVVMQKVFLHLDNKPIETKKPANNIGRNVPENTEMILTGRQALLYIDPEAGSRIFKFKDGSLYNNDRNTGEFSIFKFAEHGLHIPAIKITTSRNLETSSFTNLLQSTDNESKAEIHWRLALIFSAPVMALLAFPLSYTTPRQGRYGKLAIGILLYAVYANLIIMGQSKIEEGVIPNWLGLWWVHAIFIILALWLVRRQYGSVR